MFRALHAHLQGDTIVYMQHVVLSLSKRVRCGAFLTQAVYRRPTTNSHRE